MFFVMLVLHDNSQLDDVLSAWESAGAPGITILPSSGLARLRQNRSLEEIVPLFPSLDDFLGTREIHNATLFSIVEGEEMVDSLLDATQRITGDLKSHNTGILVVLPVLRAYGLERKPTE